MNHLALKIKLLSLRIFCLATLLLVGCSSHDGERRHADSSADNDSPASSSALYGKWSQDGREEINLDGDSRLSLSTTIDFGLGGKGSIRWDYVLVNRLSIDDSYTVAGEIDLRGRWRVSDDGSALTFAPDARSLEVSAADVDFAGVSDPALRAEMARDADAIAESARDEIEVRIAAMCDKKLTFSDMNMSSTDITFTDPFGEYIRLLNQ